MKDIKKSKNDLILKSARELFWKYGFKRVSIQEICKEADISKMTYYRFFENKIELAKAIFDKEVVTGIKEFKSILQEKGSSQEKITKMINLKQKSINGISKEFLNDFYISDETGLKTYIEEKTRFAWNEMLSDFKKAQKKGIFRKDMKPEFLFYFSQKAGEMLNDEQLNKLYNSPQELLIELGNFFAYGISPHK